MYLVYVYDQKGVQVAFQTFPVGSWQEIGYWLDEGGLIDPRYRVEVFVDDSGEVAA